jgi:hypothetical protein
VTEPIIITAVIVNVRQTWPLVLQGLYSADVALLEAWPIAEKSLEQAAASELIGIDGDGLIVATRALVPGEWEPRPPKEGSPIGRRRFIPRAGRSRLAHLEGQLCPEDLWPRGRRNPTRFVQIALP